MTIVNFTPIPALLGGAFIGLAAAALLLLNGRVFGITGIIGGIITPKRGDLKWRAVLVLGLMLGAFGAFQFVDNPAIMNTRPLPVLILGGLITGFGARLGSGCTSGHGVCGLSRLSQRSIVATITFISTGFISVYLLRLLGFAS